VTSTFVGLRIDEDLLEPFRARAESQDPTLSAEIRQALRRGLQREEHEDAEPARRSS
jgi:uncharacterized protein (DUF4415 family)